MCRVCNGDQPTFRDFDAFQDELNQKYRLYKNEGLHKENEGNFVKDSIQISSLRFTSGAEWGEPKINLHVMKHIFQNPDPEKGLLLLLLCSWMDMQEPYQIVWSNRLESIAHGNIPKMRFEKYKKPFVEKSCQTAKEYDGISRWFIEKIFAIKGQGEGNNIYRIVYFVIHDLLGQENISSLYRNDLNRLQNGIIGNNFLGNFKRLWMALMWLRLDNSVVRCLFERALCKHPNGASAVKCWYDQNVFNSIGCEIPVDGRVKTNWNSLFHTNHNEKGVAKDVRAIAHKYDIAPATFDGILFGF